MAWSSSSLDVMNGDRSTLEVLLLYLLLLPSPLSLPPSPPPDKGLHHIAYKILSYLDERSLCRAELVCHEWYQVISEGLLWKKLIERKVATDPVWKGLSERRGW